LWEPGGGSVGVWGGAGYPEGGQASSVSAVRGDRRETGLAGQYRVGRGEKVVCCPSLDPVPEAVQTSDRGGVRNEEVRPVSEYGEEEAVGDAVA